MAELFDKTLNWHNTMELYTLTIKNKITEYMLKEQIICHR